MVETIRVATWNIGSLYSDYSQNIAYIHEILINQQIDILCMQEVPNQEALLCNICDWGDFSHYVFHTTSISHVCKECEMGIAVFSRFTLHCLEVLPLTKPTITVSYNGIQEVWHDKYFMAVSCYVGSRQTLVVTGHGFPFHRYGLEKPENFHIIEPSFRELDQWFTKLSGRFSMPILCMAADFNLKEPLTFLQETASCFLDVFHNEATRPSGRKTDAILVDNSVFVITKTNICPPKENGKGILDHNFIMATLKL